MIKELKNTVVHLPTQEAYDECMRLFEDAGWKWATGRKPTEFKLLHDACVEITDRFAHSPKSYWKRKGYKIITLDKLKI